MAILQPSSRGFSSTMLRESCNKASGWRFSNTCHSVLCVATSTSLSWAVMCCVTLLSTCEACAIAASRVAVRERWKSSPIATMNTTVAMATIIRLSRSANERRICRAMMFMWPLLITGSTSRPPDWHPFQSYQPWHPYSHRSFPDIPRRWCVRRR